jgi:hypothetical protein
MYECMYMCMRACICMYMWAPKQSDISQICFMCVYVCSHVYMHCIYILTQQQSQDFKFLGTFPVKNMCDIHLHTHMYMVFICCHKRQVEDFKFLSNVAYWKLAFGLFFMLAIGVALLEIFIPWDSAKELPFGELFMMVYVMCMCICCWRI